MPLIFAVKRHRTTLERGRLAMIRALAAPFLGGLVLAGCQLAGPPVDQAAILAARQQLLQTNVCDGCNLWHVSLANADISAASLVDAEMSGASLTRAILFGADLSNAKLRRASVDGAILVNAVLRRTDFTDASLVRADLRRAELIFADFTDADARGADFSRSDLTFADLYGANFTGANLSEANLFGADFDEATNLTDANLEGALGVFEGDLDRPIKCRTIMPNGTVDNSGCR